MLEYGHGDINGDTTVNRGDDRSLRPEYNAASVRSISVTRSNIVSRPLEIVSIHEGVDRFLESGAYASHNHLLGLVTTLILATADRLGRKGI